MSPKLRKALRGGFGYAEQRRAWDAVYPDWRWCLRRVNRAGRGPPLSYEEKVRLDYLSRALQADAMLSRAWYQLLMQSLYRSCPALGGWFPR